MGGSTRIRRRSLIAITLAVSLLTTACGSVGGRGPGESRVAETEPYRPYLVGRHYQINGVWYEPEEDFAYDRVGMASWYGARFHGRRTANGETYDMNQLTAAHPTLPMPTLVRVTNLSNDRWVVVRINDRGPYAEDRIIDLSRAAASRIGMLRDGVVRVRVRVLREESVYLRELAARGRPTHRLAAEMVARANSGATRIMTAERGSERGDARRGGIRAAAREARAADRTAARAAVESEPVYRRSGATTAEQTLTGRGGPERAEAQVVATDATVADRRRVETASTVVEGPRIFVQAGAFSERENALRAGDRLSHVGEVEVTPVRVRESLYYRVRVGPARSAEDGDELLARVVRSGYPNARIVVVD